MPSTRYFWKKMKITKIGTTERVAIANIAPQSEIEVGSANIFSARDTGYVDGLLRYSSEPRKSSHFHMNEKMAHVTSAGTISGRMIRAKMP